jgi:hypothetical protein
LPNRDNQADCHEAPAINPLANSALCVLLSAARRNPLVRFRFIVSLLALLGVLLHAGLLVRHSTMMLNAKLLNQELAAALGVICHSDGTTSRLPASDLPALPEPPGNQGDCPLCMGLMAVAVLPSNDLPSFAPDLASARIAVVSEVIAPRLSAVCPPARGPPRIV